MPSDALVVAAGVDEEAVEVGTAVISPASVVVAADPASSVAVVADPATLMLESVAGGWAVFACVSC